MATASPPPKIPASAIRAPLLLWVSRRCCCGPTRRFSECCDLLTIRVAMESANCKDVSSAGIAKNYPHLTCGPAVGIKGPRQVGRTALATADRSSNVHPSGSGQPPGAAFQIWRKQPTRHGSGEWRWASMSSRNGCIAFGSLRHLCTGRYSMRQRSPLSWDGPPQARGAM